MIIPKTFIGVYENENIKLKRAVSKLLKIAPRYYILKPNSELQQNYY